MLKALILALLMLVTTNAHAGKVPPMTDNNAIMTIMGEEEDNYICMLYVASTLRNRKTLQGAYGYRAIKQYGNSYYRGNRKLSKDTYNKAQRAWEESKYDNKGCYHWFSKQDLKQPNVQHIIKNDKLKLVASFGKGRYINYFYARP